MDNNFINNNPLTPYLTPTATQDEGIICIVSDFDEAIVAAKKELELWKELKKGLLQQMFV